VDDVSATDSTFTDLADNPMSDDDLAAKFTDNAAPRLGADRAARLLDACWAADTTDDFAELVLMTGVRS
jgi:hypothetical protein